VRVNFFFSLFFSNIGIFRTLFSLLFPSLVQDVNECQSGIFSFFNSFYLLEGFDCTLEEQLWV
jgi:hypothetical protein